jgi:hypothetical protein
MTFERLLVLLVRGRGCHCYRWVEGKFGPVLSAEDHSGLEARAPENVIGTTECKMSAFALS